MNKRLPVFYKLASLLQLSYTNLLVQLYASKNTGFDDFRALSTIPSCVYIRNHGNCHKYLFDDVT